MIAIDADGETLADGTGLDVLAELRHVQIDLVSADDSAAIGILLHVQPNDHPASISIRGHDGLSVRVHGFRWADGLAILDGTAIFPNADGSDSLTVFAESIGWKLPSQNSIFARVQAWRNLHRYQLERLGNLSGVKPAGSLASTGLRAALPVSWRRGAERMLRSEKWSWIRQSYYGGRVELYQPGWVGQSVEYDLRSAYGWALTQPLPDWQLYDTRRILKREPGWLEVSVDLGPNNIGPLPCRDDENPHRLAYPTARQVRGVYTRQDLERAEMSGAKIISVHRQIAGRWSDDLRIPVCRWLEMREKTTDAGDRATLRGLSV